MQTYALLILAAVPLAVLCQGGRPPLCTEYECPQYTSTDLEQQSGENTWNELRTLGETRWVSTEYWWSSMAFWRLFRYIQGSNDQSLKMDMTAPVLMGKREGGPKTMQFFIGANVATVPRATGTWTPVTRLNWPAGTQFYVRTFYTMDSYPSDSDNARELAALRTDVGNPTLYDGSIYYTAGYNSPMDRGQRRNEIWIPKL